MVATAQEIAKSHNWHHFIGLQYYYSAVSRDIEHELVPMAQHHKLAIFPWSPLAGGFLWQIYPSASCSRFKKREF
jgi:aryl-alcohol dehydrogenase-like predicted oxidoreductase